ncbi:MAG TPA: hypothetical protein VGN72_16240 [Tepidisphaeraceae bacterium]|nr:hypothetical protein [Tepidisphaeraceae bacterium]
MTTRFTCIGSIVALLSPAPLLAQVKQEDVFRSINDSMTSQGSNGSSILLLVGGGVGVLLLLAFLSRRGENAPAVRSVNHAGKLLREVRKQIGLKPVELKQLKLVADQLSSHDGEPVSPLTLIVCPSVLVKAIQNENLKIDRAVLSGLVKRIKVG